MPGASNANPASVSRESHSEAGPARSGGEEAVSPGELPYIVEDDSVRYLYFSQALIQSAMRVDCPDALDLAYTRAMMAALLFQPNPRNILLLGLGGGSLAKFCFRRLQHARITAVEIDANVIALRDRFRIPPDNERFRIIHADAAEFVQTADKGCDLLLVDAFDRHGLAPSLENGRFLADCRALLCASGVLAMNLADDEYRCDRIIREARSVFDQRTLLLPVREDGNRILFAFAHPQFWPRWRFIEQQAKALKSRFELDFPSFAKHLQNASRRGFAESLGHLPA